MSETSFCLFSSVLRLVNILILHSLLQLFLAETKQERMEELYLYPQTSLKLTLTTLRVVVFDIGMKGTVTNRHQDFKALLHSNFCLHLLFQNFNSLFYVTVNFIRRGGRHLLDESRKQCELHPSLTLTPLLKEPTSAK